MGEVADWMVEQAMQDWKGDGYAGRTKASLYYFNPYMDMGNYTKLTHVLMHSLSGDKRLNKTDAKRFIYDNLVKKGKFPYPRISKLNSTEINSILQIIKKSNCELNEDEQLAVNKHLGANPTKTVNKEETKMNRQVVNTAIQGSNVPKAEVEELFRVETIDAEEGEFSLVLERGMYREVVAVSYSFPHYRKLGFYAGRKSSIFSNEADTDKMVVNIPNVFRALATLLNNLSSADKLTEEVYNSAVDGFETFIYEALDYSEIESLIGKTSGLKDGKKKRIKARGTKGSALQNK